MKNSKGITLIALIITIVVLLILAGVAIGTLDKSNIIGRAQETTSKYEEEKEKENKVLLDAESLLDKYKNSGDEDEETNVEALFARFKDNPEDFKHPEQSETNADRAIGTDGTAVNMDWWKYEQDDANKEIALHEDFGSSWCYSAYKNDIEDGKIKGSVPQYIKPAGSNDIYTVTDVSYAFNSINELEIAPEIPNTVTNMDHTFSGCTSLTKAPRIPNGVTNMNNTFSGCTSLTETLRIESVNVENVYSLISDSKITKIQVPANSVTESTIRELFGSDSNITIETF